MKTIKSVITLAFVLLLSLAAKAQWAGEDKEVLREPDNSQVVTIGVMDGSSDKCYEWSGPNIYSIDHNQPVILVNPQSSEETYICTRTSSCGVEQDEVKVKVIDTIALVSVTPLKSCYNHGDPIVLSDFVIVTYPTGYESLVTVTPNVAENNFQQLHSYDEDELTFSLTYNGHTSTKTATVRVYNEALTFTDGESVNFTDFKKKLTAIKIAVEKGKEVVNYLNQFATASPCHPGGNLVVNLPNAEFFYTCCNGNEVNGFTVTGFSFNPELAIECHFPTSLSIPGAGGLYIHFKAAVGANVGPLTITYKGDCSNVSIPILLYASIQAGAEAVLLHPDVFSAAIDIKGKGTGGINWILGQELAWTGLTVEIGLDVTFTYFGGFMESKYFPLYTHTFFKGNE